MKAVARKTLVVLTILGNLFLIGIGIFIMEEYQYDEEFGIFCIIIAVLNLIATPYKIASGRFNWLSLYFERKAEEERIKLDELKKHKKNDQKQ